MSVASVFRRAAIAAGLVLSLAATAATAAEPIRIGEINSYSAVPGFTIPYRNGWELAVEQINEKGGVLGRRIEVISRDDAGKPADAVRIAEELVAREKVDLLMGTFLSNVGLAVADFAKQNRIVFVAAEPLTDAMTMEKGNRYTFRLRPGTFMQAAMLVPEAAKLKAKRWAFVAPNYEYGTSAVAAFKKLLKRQQPDVQFVGEQFPALGKIDAGATVQALMQSNPDAIFSALFAGDLAKFVREAQVRGLLDKVKVVSLLTGEPEYLDPLKDEAPEGWIVTGYPWYGITTPEHKAFLAAYQKKYNDYPRLGSVVGYATVKAIAAGIAKAGSTETENLIKALEGVAFETPFGPASFRAVDHQSTMGAYVGRVAVKDGKGVMADWYYAPGEKFMFSEEEVRGARPSN